MSREEIYEYLNYQGVYDDKIRRKLNKLIKKYHPDKNKNDKTTILVLYDVKKELESGKTINLKPEKKNQTKKQEKEEDEFSKYEPFIKRMIEILQRRKKKIDSELSKLYKRENLFSKRKLEFVNQLNAVNLNFDNLQKELLLVNKLSSLDIVILLIIVIIFILFIYNQNIFLLLLLLFLLLLLILKAIFKVKVKKNLEEKLLSLNQEKEMITSKKNEYEKIVKDLNKKCVELKFRQRALSNDIQFYHYELSKILSSSYIVKKDIDKDRSYQRKI